MTAPTRNFYRKDIKRASHITLLLLTTVSLLSGCSNDAMTGEWYFLASPDSAYFVLDSNGKAELFDGKDHYSGEWTHRAEEELLCLDFGSRNSVCGSVKTVDGVKIAQFGIIGVFVYGKENVEKALDVLEET